MSAKKRILFVDDEPRILAGLEGLLHKQRKRWEMTFALGGAAALEELARARYDVVVTDMRMPGVDGPALLKRVKESWPEVARIVLSGQADQDEVLRALPHAQQFLSKPCEAQLLQLTLERTCELQDLLEDQALRRVVGALDRLPSAPRSYFALATALARPAVDIAEISDIVESDPAMGVKVLQLVNSAFFGVVQPVRTVHQAVSYLGAELISGVAMMTNAFASVETATVPGFSLEATQERAIACAHLVRRFLPRGEQAQAAMTAALFHEIGKTLMAWRFPAQFATALRRALAEEKPLASLERELIGATDARLGACLLGAWGLPLAIVEAVAHFQEPGLRTCKAAPEAIAAVHVAHVLVANAAGSEGRAAVDLQFLIDAGLEGDLQHWTELAGPELASRKASTHRSAP